MYTEDLFTTPNGEQEPRKVTCLGKEFESDEARRQYFTEQLRQHLQDPEFRKTEGFPIGTDEDILNLSDPPYYTACPNPWTADFIAEWAQAQEAPAEPYHREPFAADVSEGKNDPVYKAHAYHTKVPHKAIMRYLLHYTNPGDVVFDGFCGSGMTGVAAQMCGNRDAVLSLGYRVEEDGSILREETDADGHTAWVPFSRLGARKAILNDLAPAATFIAYNYNTPVNAVAFQREAQRILREVEQECGWMYETLHTDGVTKGRINYTVWSDVFICPACAGEIVFWDAAVDQKNGKVADEFPCPHCQATLTKRAMERCYATHYDDALNQSVRQAKQVPVRINYSIGKKRFDKTPSPADLALIDQINESPIPFWFPTDRMIDGKESRRNDPVGITHVHQFYTRRGLWEMAAIWEKANKHNRTAKCIQLSHTAANSYTSKLRRFRADKKGGGPLAGTLYIASLITPPNPILTVGRNVNFINNALTEMHWESINSIISCQSKTELTNIPSNALDYIFIDPPFGANLNYSELNFIWESWLKVQTNNKEEAIENPVQEKGGEEYRELMQACFREAYRVLKPGRWMTVEFSNTKAAVWNSIQTALTDAGFIVANVSALDKKQGSFNAVTNTTSVKQDLVISAYKPNGGFEDRFREEAGTEEGVWDFVRTHLKYLPVTKIQGGELHMVPERDPRLLYDQLVAYHVRKGYRVPISSREFQTGLAQRFMERDGMYFLPDQTAEYDRRKQLGGGNLKQAELFVCDESTAIEWLRQTLKTKPQTFADLNPQFMQKLGGWNKNETQLDLRELLNQNFLCYEGNTPVPEQIHTYLSTNWKELRHLPKDDPALMDKAENRWYVPDPNKASDLEKLREKALLKEFEEYKEAKKKLKVFRLEAVRAGFKKAWQEKDYAVIAAVADKLPTAVLEEDPKLLMWYDQATLRINNR